MRPRIAAIPQNGRSLHRPEARHARNRRPQRDPERGAPRHGGAADDARPDQRHCHACGGMQQSGLACAACSSGASGVSRKCQNKQPEVHLLALARRDQGGGRSQTAAERVHTPATSRQHKIGSTRERPLARNPPFARISSSSRKRGEARSHPASSGSQSYSHHSRVLRLALPGCFPRAAAGRGIR